MSTQLKLRGGIATACDQFIGTSKELIVDTTNWNLRLHDGVTLGGHIVGSGTGGDGGGGGNVVTYMWIKYADSPTTGMSDSPAGKTYIGLAFNKTTAIESTNYADYNWSLIGTVITNPDSTYTWVAYAISPDGTSGFSFSPVGATYIGLAYNQTSSTASTDPTKYSWSPIGSTIINNTYISYGIPTVTSLPATGTEGQMVIYNGEMYVWHNNAWITVKAWITPDTPTGIEIVYTLPITGIEGQIVFLSSIAIGGNKLYRWTNGTWVAVAMSIDNTAIVADASITIAKFAQGITPIEIVGTLPSIRNFEGRIVYYTVDNLLHRYTGSAWTTSINAADITGTITSTQIGTNQIATGHLQTNSITSAQLAAGSIIAGKIAAGAISTTELAAGAVHANNLYAGCVTADKIAASSITANKIAAGSITAACLATDALIAGTIQAGSIGTTQLAANAVTAQKLAANSVYAGAIQAGAITAASIGVNDLSSINTNTGTLTVGNASGTGYIIAGSAAISGTTMSGIGASFKQFGNFCIGNSTTNITFPGDKLYLNGNIVSTGNIQDNAVSSSTYSAFSDVSVSCNNGSQWGDWVNVINQVITVTSGGSFTATVNMVIDGLNSPNATVQFWIRLGSNVNGGNRQVFGYKLTGSGIDMYYKAPVSLSITGTGNDTIQVYAQAGSDDSMTGGVNSWGYTLTDYIRNITLTVTGMKK